MYVRVFEEQIPLEPASDSWKHEDKEILRRDRSVYSPGAVTWHHALVDGAFNSETE